MSILRDGFPDVHSNPFDLPADLDSVVLTWDDFDRPAPGVPRLPFAEWVAVQASWFRSQGTTAGDWLAEELDRLASLARGLGAESPAEFESLRGPD